MTNLQLLKTLVRLAQIAEEVEEVNPAAANEIDLFSKDVTSVLPEKLVDDTAPNEGDTINPAMFPPIETPEAPIFDADQDFEDPTFDDYTSDTEMPVMPEMNEEQIAQLEDRITNEIINKITNTPKFAPFGTPKWEEAVQNLITERLKKI